MAVHVGRNEECPCGSGQKFKRCCLEARADVRAGRGDGIDAAALVARAAASKDWSKLDDHVAAALAVFARGAPLEHVRLPAHLVANHDPAAPELQRLCPAGWLERCELEIVAVLEAYELGAAQRDGLRVCLQLLARFGAASPIVEDLARMQAAEHAVRAQRVADALSQCGVRASEAMRPAWDGLLAWLRAEQPAVLGFADWFALAFAGGADELLRAWSCGISDRVADACLAHLAHASSHHAGARHADAHQWAMLAALAMFGVPPQPATDLVRSARLVEPLAEEARVHAGFLAGTNADAETLVALEQIMNERATRGDFGAAATIRETLWRILHARSN